MSIIRSLGALQRPRDSAPPPTYLQTGSGSSLGGYSYASLYHSQPEVRVVVDFLGRNIAQLGLHLFEVLPDGDRLRDRTHECARLLAQPNPTLSRYRLIDTTVQDIAIYGQAFWVKRRDVDGVITMLWPIPVERMQVSGDLAPTAYRYTDPASGVSLDFSPKDVVHFRAYDPQSRIRGVSALESLKSIVVESRAASETRTQFWRNGARFNGVIERPRESGKWTVDARERFRSQFAQRHGGVTNAGSIPVLEDGMTFKPVVSTMQDAESVASQKLSREEVARAYHIPLPMVGILDHATFGNIKEQHRMLYQDCLGPWLTLLSEDIELQLLRDWSDAATHYLEFNILEKLSGSFEEQAAAYQSAAGRPWMTVDEVRQRQNLPRLGGDASRVALPLNLSVGGETAEDAEEATP